MAEVDAARRDAPPPLRSSSSRTGTSVRERWSQVSRRTRRGTWLALAAVLVVGVSVALDVGGRTTTGDRARDLRAFVAQINTDLASCNASLRDSLDAYASVVSGHPNERSASETIITGNEPECTPVSNSDLYDLDSTEAPATLRSYPVQSATNQVTTWAYPDAARVISDLGLLLAHPGDRIVAADLQREAIAMSDLAGSAGRSLAATARALHTGISRLDIGATSRLEMSRF